MHVISQKALWDFVDQHDDAKMPLRAWLKLVRLGKFQNLAELKSTFASVDVVPVKGGNFYVFNIGGNKYRLRTAVHLNTQKLFVRHILTHSEYDKGQWKK